jgi:hypothetical protein
MKERLQGAKGIKQRGGEKWRKDWNAIYSESSRMSTLVISTFRDRLRRIGMRPRGWRMGLSHSPGIVRIALSSITLRLSLKWVCLFLRFVSWDSPVFQRTCFCALCPETLQFFSALVFALCVLRLFSF